ncbi:hypothetical protein Y032_0522g2886 [Ancylostoma ceylanicum]|uniref:SCP domain-containing protein n=1 Tax=Ancylostoma ceylanicum TaxID=53326 RepID=A0A016WSM9_9BILA|nr:hypothetical protein Y032_0522g2886 [Ancylostoma ceylanicum]
MWSTSAFLALSVTFLFSNVNGFDVPKPFGCKNSLISDEWRQMVLETHNKYRAKLSEGKQPSLGKPAKAAKKMNELVWDCTIEQHAFETACTGTVDKQKFSENKATFKSRTCNDTEATKKLLKTWWDEARQVDLDASQKYEQTLEHFGPVSITPKRAMPDYG